MSHPTRRRFLHSTMAVGAGLSLARVSSGIEPIARKGDAKIKLSLAAYSFNGAMSLKGKSKPTMTMDDFADFAVSIGLDAIEPTSYYFADTSRESLTKFRARCTRLGLDISGTAIGNDFCKSDAAELKKEIDAAKQWIENASRLGAKTIRIFAGTAPKNENENLAFDRAVASIEEVCEYAGNFGILLALENHGGITSTADQLLAIVKAVKSPWFGVNLDTGNFHTEDPYADLARAAPYAVTVQLKTEVTPKGKKKEYADLSRLFQILRDAKYRGYVALEYEAAEDPKTAVPRVMAELRKLV